MLAPWIETFWARASARPLWRMLAGWARVACVAVLLVSTAGCGLPPDPRSSSEQRADDFVDRGRAAENADSLRVALEWYQRATEADSNSAIGQLLTANTHARLGEFEAALPHIEQLIRLRPDFARGYLDKSWYLRELGQLDASRRAVHVGIGLDPEKPLGYALLGATYLREGLPGTARAYYLEAVSRYEDEAILRRQLLTEIDSVAANAPDEARIDVPQMVADLEAAWANQVAQDVAAPGTPVRPRSKQSLLALLATWLTVVAGILTLFQQTEDTVTGPQRERIRAWLLHRRPSDSPADVSGESGGSTLPEEGSMPPKNKGHEEATDPDEEVDISKGADPGKGADPAEAPGRADWSSTFVELFESVFGPSHWTGRCLSRSAVATLWAFVVILVVTADAQSVPGNLSYGGGLANLAALLSVMFVSNLVADYLSLYETRWVLGRLATAPGGTLGKVGFLLLDLVLTTLIVIATTAGVLVVLAGIGQVITLPAMLEPTLNNLQSWSTSLGDGRRLLADGTSVELFPALAMLGSTYFTSIWAVLYVGAGIALRWTRRVFDGVAGLSRVLDVDQRPLQAMGIALSVVVTAVWTLGHWLF